MDFGRCWDKRSGCIHPQWWCSLFNGRVGGVMITYPQRYNRLWLGRGLEVWSGSRREDFGELLECSDMVGRKMEARRRFQ